MNPDRALFNRLIDRVLTHEGGYVNNPKDPGGETNWGIAKRSYPTLDIRALTREQALEIYYADFWVRSRASLLPKALAFQVLDLAVNSGTHYAIETLQRIANVKVDGVWGPVTSRAIETLDANDALLLLIAARLEFMATRAVWPFFSKGWALRIVQNLRFAAEDN